MSFDKEQKEYWENRTNVRPYNHPAVQIFARQRVDFIHKITNAHSFSTALDVGCGDGFGMHYMTEMASRKYGCDRSAAMLAANPSENRRLIRSDAYCLPYRDKSFDLVYCWELLHHIEEPLSVVDEIKRVARKGVLICEPNTLNPAMALFGLLEPGELGVLRFTPAYMKRLFRHIGLHQAVHYSTNCYTPNKTPLWLTQLLKKLPFRWPLIGLYNISFGLVD